MSKPKHHVRDSVCATRAPYREGRKPKAVKVYTIQHESKYLLVQGIPAVGATQQLIALFASHGQITEHRMLDDYPSEQFTDVCLIKFQKIQAARAAKRHLDDWSFYGGVLHVCYAPEYESVQDTREKLQDRRKTIAAKVRQYGQDGTYKSKLEGQTRHNKHSNSTEESHGLVPVVSETVPQFSSQTAQQTMPDYCKREENQTTVHNHMTNTNYSHITRNQNPGRPTEYKSNVTNSGSKSTDSLHVNSAASMAEQESEQLCLPPPPKQTKFSTVPGLKPTSQKLRRGPSAQAMFPPGFDARTDQPSGVSLTEYLSRKGPNALNQEIADESTAKTVQEKIDENLKSSSVVVKPMPKKLSVPKFVPRQAQARFKQKSAEMLTSLKEPSKLETEEDAINKNLKRNAFTLGQPQGPVDLDEHKRVRPGPEEVSVQKSVKQIREKLSKVSKSSNLDQVKER